MRPDIGRGRQSPDLPAIPTLSPSYHLLTIPIHSDNIEKHKYHTGFKNHIYETFSCGILKDEHHKEDGYAVYANGIYIQYKS